MVRLTNWIGDAVMNTPALGAVRHSYPEAEIVLVANPLVAKLFASHPYCDRVLVFDKRGAHSGIGGFLRFCRLLRAERFDAAILLQKAFEAALMSALALIPRRLGYATDARAALLSHSMPLTDEVRCQHHTEHYLHLLRSFGIEGGDGQQRLEVTQEEYAWAKAQLGEGIWFAINPGAAYGSAKRWIPERFAAVADELAERFGARILLTGGPAETEIGSDIAGAMKVEPLNFIGKTSVREMMALLSRCSLVVSNDSGPMHVAAALGIPIVAIFGPTDHTTTHPLSQMHRIVRKPLHCAPCLKRVCPTDHRCMEAVTAAEVVEAARELLGEAQIP